jgi:hypothetical protein
LAGVSPVPVEPRAPDRVVGSGRALRPRRRRPRAHVLVRDQERPRRRAR